MLQTSSFAPTVCSAKVATSFSLFYSSRWFWDRRLVITMQYERVQCINVSVKENTSGLLRLNLSSVLLSLCETHMIQWFLNENWYKICSAEQFIYMRQKTKHRLLFLEGGDRCWASTDACRRSDASHLAVIPVHVCDLPSTTIVTDKCCRFKKC